MALALLVLGSSCLGCAALRVSRSVKPATTFAKPVVVHQVRPLTTVPRRQMPGTSTLRKAANLGTSVPSGPPTFSDQSDRSDRQRR